MKIEKAKKLEPLWKDRELKVGDWVYYYTVEKILEKGLISYDEGDGLVVQSETASDVIPTSEMTLIPSTRDMLSKLPGTIIENGQIGIRYLTIWLSQKGWVVCYESGNWQVGFQVNTNIDEALADMLYYIYFDKKLVAVPE